MGGCRSKILISGLEVVGRESFLGSTIMMQRLGSNDGIERTSSYRFQSTTFGSLQQREHDKRADDNDCSNVQNRFGLT